MCVCVCVIVCITTAYYVYMYISLPHLQDHTATVYTESIEKLRSVLLAMQTMSQKREQLEKRVRSQLEAEIRQLKAGAGERVDGKETEGLIEEVTEQASKIATLEGDVAKVLGNH